MTHLREMMLEELERHNYAQTTTHSKIRLDTPHITDTTSRRDLLLALLLVIVGLSGSQGYGPE